MSFSLSNPLPLSTCQGEGPKEPRAMAEANAMATFDRPPVMRGCIATWARGRAPRLRKFVGGYLEHEWLIFNGFHFNFYLECGVIFLTELNGLSKHTD